jgi:hypothetical protein
MQTTGKPEKENEIKGETEKGATAEQRAQIRKPKKEHQSGLER